MASYDNKVVTGGSVAKMKEWIDARFNELNAVDMSMITDISDRLQAIETVLNSGTIASNGKKGWAKLPNGMKVMWWEVNLTSSSERTNNLPYTGVFESGFTIVANSEARVAISTSMVSITQYTIRQDSSNSYTAHVIAIGK